MDFGNLENNLNETVNNGGLKRKVYYALHGDVATWPTIPAESATDMTIEKMGELVGNLVMKAEKKMHFFYMTQDEGKLDYEGVGELHAKSFLAKLRIYRHAIINNTLGFLNTVKNKEMIFIVPDSNGNLFLLGDEDRAATLDSIDGFTTGQKREERPGIGMVFSYNTANVYKYMGDIPTVPPVSANKSVAPKTQKPPGS